MSPSPIRCYCPPARVLFESSNFEDLNNGFEDSNNVRELHPPDQLQNERLKELDCALNLDIGE